MGSLGFALEVVWFFSCRSVNYGARSGSLGSSGVFDFTRVRPGGRSVNPGSFGSLDGAVVVVGTSGVAEFTLVRPGGRWVHQRWLGSLKFTLGLVGFIRCHWVLSGWTWGL